MSELPDHLRTATRSLAPSPFPGDDGQADPAVRHSLAAAAPGGDPGAYLAAVAALGEARLLVPVVATRIGESAVKGDDKEAEMAVVLLQNAEGDRAMLAFTGLDALGTWDPTGRPVPVTLDLAARSALDDGAVALMVDVAGPHPLVLERDLLAELARGHRLVDLGDGRFGWAVPADRPGQRESGQNESGQNESGQEESGQE